MKHNIIFSCLFPLLVLPCIAYAEKTKSPNKQEKLTSLFSLSLTELMEVEISTTPARVILVTRQDIQRDAYPRLSDILQHVSGDIVSA